MNGDQGVPAAIDQIAAVLARHGLRHAFGGALAQNYWGVVRATQDVDVLALIPALEFQKVVDALTTAGFCARDDAGNQQRITVAAARESLRNAGLFAVWLGTVKVEIFTPMLPIQHRILERAVLMPWGDRTIPVTTAEDLIVLKMVFHRDKDMRDIRAMLAVRGKLLDQAYVLDQASSVLDASGLAELRRLMTNQ